MRNRANQAFRQAAQSVAQSHSSLGAYYRAMRARLGPKQAIVATAHKIARIVYHLLKTGEPYQEESGEEYERKRQEPNSFTVHRFSGYFTPSKLDCSAFRLLNDLLQYSSNSLAG